METPLVIERDHNSILLGWQRVENSLEYELQMKTVLEEEWKTLSSTIKGTTIRKKNLEENMDYQFRIRAHLREGWDMFSSPIDVRVVPSHVRLLESPALKAHDGSSITVEWEPVEGVEGYRLRYREEDNISWHYVDSVIHSNLAKKKSLRLGIGYYFSVLPIGGEGEWEYSRSSLPLHLLESQLSPFLSNLLPKQLLGPRRSTVDTAEALANKVIAVYFSAHWCPPCRAFTPNLASVYQQAKAAGKNFEVIFCSGDHSEAEFLSYFDTMPWLAIKYDDDEREEFMNKFQVRGIPKLCVLAPSGKILVDNAVNPNISVSMIDQWIQQGANA
jgi:thiol-disulfide isomerase/thioredoxin